MKRTRLPSFILILSIIIYIIGSFSVSADAICWYIKRNGNSRPILSEEQMVIYKYSGTYIDRSVSDNSDDKRLYLTFDAGYENGNIERILDVLKKEDVPAAFFVLDNIILKNTDLIIRMVDEGHLVCNHTKNHKDLTKLSKDEIERCVLDLEKIYTEKTGRELSKYFRFPEGRYSCEALAKVQSLGYKTVFWSFAYDDWDNARQPRPERAIKKILANTHNGAVILLHPTSKTNADIMEALIGEWKAEGYRFCSLDELGFDI